MSPYIGKVELSRQLVLAAIIGRVPLLWCIQKNSEVFQNTASPIQDVPQWLAYQLHRPCRQRTPLTERRVAARANRLAVSNEDAKG